VNDLFLRACRREPVERTPLWLMRQAGRYLPEYRALRECVDFLTLCRTPELAVQATLQPLARFDLDAAILFSDILIPAGPMGFAFDFRPGPVLERPVRTADDVARVRVGDAEEDLGFVLETVRLARAELAGRVPLIGFAAAPWTLASYLVEGRGSSDFSHLRGMIQASPALAHTLLDKVARVTAAYLAAQIRAGVQAVQLFDTWAGLLGRADYREFGLRYARRVLDELAGQGVPRLYFALGAGHLLDEIRDSHADVVGLDWRLPLGEAAARLGPGFALQGNLDPAVLLGPAEAVERRAAEVLADARGLPGHVFNLGHGVLPGTPIERVETLVRTVRR
jgi:uroporphyrinogen decarboxylase